MIEASRKLGRIRRISANVCEVQVGEDVFRCKIRKKLGRGRSRRISLKLAAVGDEVEFTPGAGAEGEIERLLPRRTSLSRHDVLRPTREQVIVANVDELLCCQAAAEPELEPLQIDRALIMAAAGGMRAALCVNKTDLRNAEEIEASLRPYRALEIPILLVSARTGAGLDALRGRLEGRTTVLMGPSGVGKSSLLNAIDPSLKLPIAEVSRKTGEGTHTTSWAELLRVGGAWVADTPGLEFFTLWGVDERNLPSFFAELRGLACRFKDCAHTVEPGCAAADPARVHPRRLESYRRILEEIRARPKTYRREGRRRLRARYEEAESREGSDTEEPE